MSHFEWSKSGPPFPLDVTSYSATRREKFDLLNAKKSFLGLCATSLVPVPHVSLHPSGPVFERTNGFYDGGHARNEATHGEKRGHRCRCQFSCRSRPNSPSYRAPSSPKRSRTREEYTGAQQQPPFGIQSGGLPLWIAA